VTRKKRNVFPLSLVVLASLAAVAFPQAAAAQAKGIALPEALQRWAGRALSAATV
jgi:hypothetical protein